MSQAHPNIGESPKRDETANVIVRGSAAGFAQEIFTGSHSLRADEPAAVGGTDTDRPYTTFCSRPSAPARL
jgi:hypothetical protein